MSQKPASGRDLGRTPRRLAVALVVVLAIAVPTASASGIAKVWIANDQPLVVRGTGFHATSQVSVAVSKLKRTYRSTVMSGSAGGFAVHFKVNLPTRCGTTVVTATDAAGRRVTSRIVANDCSRGGGKI
jgi:hypothetical protein